MRLLCGIGLVDLIKLGEGKAKRQVDRHERTPKKLWGSVATSGAHRSGIDNGVGNRRKIC